MAQFAANVVVLAGIYTLLASGWVIVYKASRLVNFAFGELMMLSGYFMFTLATMIPANLGINLVLTFALGFVVGWVIYYLLMRPMIGQPIFAALVLTIGLSIFLRGVATVAWGSKYRVLAQTLGIENEPHRFFSSFSLSTLDLYIIGAAVVYLLGIAAFLRFTIIGIQMRAAADNSLLAAQRGINIYVCFALAWSLASVGATIAGILYGVNYRIDPDVGSLALKALPVALLSGMDSLRGVIPAALMVALIETGALRYVDPLMGDVAPMVLMLLVLILRPWGLFGTKEELERV